MTRFFSWGPYERVEQPEAYIAGLPRKRDARRAARLPRRAPRGRARSASPACPSSSGATAARRSARWFGHRWWGSGANLESKALIARAGLRAARAGAPDRLGRTRATGARSRALERIGFRREGVLAAWHRHGDGCYDVVVFGMLRAAWERSPLPDVPAEVARRRRPPRSWWPDGQALTPQGQGRRRACARAARRSSRPRPRTSPKRHRSRPVTSTSYATSTRSPIAWRCSTTCTAGRC